MCRRRWRRRTALCGLVWRGDGFLFFNNNKIPFKGCLLGVVVAAGRFAFLTVCPFVVVGLFFVLSSPFARLFEIGRPFTALFVAHAGLILCFSGGTGDAPILVETEDEAAMLRFEFTAPFRDGPGDVAIKIFNERGQILASDETNNSVMWLTEAEADRREHDGTWMFNNAWEVTPDVDDLEMDAWLKQVCRHFLGGGKGGWVQVSVSVPVCVPVCVPCPCLFVCPVSVPDCMSVAVPVCVPVCVSRGRACLRVHVLSTLCHALTGFVAPRPVDST